MNSRNPEQIGSMVALGKYTYDPQLRARIFPWMDRVHTWVGFAYHFDDRERGDCIVYCVPVTGAMTYHVHQTEVEVNWKSGNPTFKTKPNPDTDEVIGSFGLPH